MYDNTNPTVGLPKPKNISARPQQPSLLRMRRRSECVDSRSVDRLIAALRGRGRVPRRRLRADLTWGDDFLCAVARASSGQVIGMSNGGYGLVEELPSGDVGHWLAETQSRARELHQRMAAVIRVLNGRNRGGAA